MRETIRLLVLLFSVCGAQTASTQTEVQTESQSTGAAAAEDTTQLDVSTELRELRDMVVELRVLLTVTQNELHNTKSELDKMEAENEAMKTRLAASETEVVNLSKDAGAQRTDLITMKTEVENLKMETAATEAELTGVMTRLAATETDVVNLEREITERPKVAFSAGLFNSGFVQAGNTNMNLVFTKIITNIGQAYSKITGFFTAPVKGVYYFRFTVMDFPKSYQMTILMYKNENHQIRLDEYATDGQHQYLSSGVTLQLEVGDVVNMRLIPGKRLYDDSSNHSTFSGFLLFPL